MEYTERGHKTYRILAMNALTGAIRTVIEEKAQTFVNYTRHFRFDLSEGRQIIWMSERDSWNHLYLYDTASISPPAASTPKKTPICYVITASASMEKT